MSRLLIHFALLLVAAVPSTVAAALRHDLQVTVEPGIKEIEVVDTIELPFAPANGRYEFMLNQSFTLEGVKGGKVTVRERTPPPPEPPGIGYSFQLDQIFSQAKRDSAPVSNTKSDNNVLRYEDIPSGITLYHLEAQQQTVTLRYRARFNQLSADKAGIVLAYPNGSRTADGIFLDPGAAWYPLFGGSDNVLTFSMEVNMPEQWAAISQGELSNEVLEGGSKRVVWQERQPQQGIFLIAGHYVTYAEKTHGYQSQVFLRQADDKLANDYLGLTHEYISLYEKLIGGYPYSKFAMVESFWESGFGMPSFTFIGPSVIRLPFIRTTSYPHEILHNWWGNSVYVDYNSGNWSEGLTSYLADYMLDEQRGNGTNHRREMLQKYTDFIRGDNDFSLSQFTSSHDAQGQAVGYGKALMLFHMLRIKLGDEKFMEALRLFNQQYKFKTASYVDIERVFTQVYGNRLTEFFDQWVRRVGAPELAVIELQRLVAGNDSNKKWRVEGDLKQMQIGSPYLLDVPVIITVEGEPATRQFTLAMKDKQQHFSFDLDAKPLRLDVDPEFDLFRRLSVEETPPALSQFFGAEEMVLVISERAPAELKRLWRQLAQEWGVEVKSDSELQQLPTDRAVWLLGWDNRLLDPMRRSFAAYGATVTPMQVTLEGKEYRAGKDSVVLAAHNPANPQHSVVWFASTAADAVERYGQRLPHYRKYSYLVFDKRHNNVLKGQWAPLTSPLSVTLEWGKTITPVWPVRPPLVNLVKPVEAASPRLQ